MRQVLFRIPLDGPWSLGPLGEVPGFGFGIVLLLWAAFGAWWLYRHRQSLGIRADVLLPAGLWLVVAWAIVMTPQWAQRPHDRAVATYTEAIERSATPQAEHYYQRGLAWLAKREYGKAVEDFRTAIEVDPQFEPAYHRLAWLRATSPRHRFRDGAEAVRLAEQAASIGIRHGARDLDVLAAAYAEAGRFDDAVQQAERAALLAGSSRDVETGPPLADIRRRLAQYREHEPYRDAPPARSIPVYGYGFMLFLGILAAGWDATRRARRVGLVTKDPGQPNVIWDIGIWSTFGGIAGARLFYLAQYHERVFAGASGLGEILLRAVNLPDGGLVLYGGLITGAAVCIASCRLRGIPVLLFGDLVIPAMFLALAFGRIGCLMNGCCYGDRCELPWAIEFPIGSVPDMSLVNRGFVQPHDVGSAISAPVMRLHPSQIYSSLNALVLWLVTATYFRYRNRDGAVLAVGLLVYPVTRFLIEYVRGDEMGQFDTSLTISQIVSLGMFATGLLYLAWLSLRPPALTLQASDSTTEPSVASKRPASAKATAAR